jgi:hypothetical protein
MKDSTIPQAVKATLWSYDTDKMDLENDKVRIITNVLNHGTKEATDWLFGFYDKEDIKAVLLRPKPGEWNKKSLNLWSLVFNVQPIVTSKFDQI